MWYHTNSHLNSHQGFKLNFNWFQLLTVEWHISPLNSLYCSWHFKPFWCYNISQHLNSDPHNKPHKYRRNFYLFSVSQRTINFLWFLKFTWNSPNNVYWFHSTVQLSESTTSVKCVVQCILPSSSKWSIRVKVEVMDSFTVTFLMEDLLLNLQIPQTPRVVITAERQTDKYSVCVLLCIRTQKHSDEFTWLFPETSQKDARSLETPAQCVPRCPPPAHHYGNQGEGSD